jgi:hypothetical protein
MCRTAVANDAGAIIGVAVGIALGVRRVRHADLGIPEGGVMDERASRFIPGAVICRAYYEEAVRPILERHIPALSHSAAKLHRGSEVLGFDTPQSMDHDWGPANLELFLDDDAHTAWAGPIDHMLAAELPREFWGVPSDLFSVGATTMGGADCPLAHRIRCTTVEQFFRESIGLNPLSTMDAVDWLTITPQYLRAIVSGPVFHDGLGALTRVRERLAWYPTDLWLYLLAAQWRRIDQESPFMARCGDVGDELGSRVVAARMIDELMKLCFLMERVYWPYSKWFGSAFARLDAATSLIPIFHAILDSRQWREREHHLSAAYICVADMHNALQVTPFIEPRVVPFYSRPYQVPEAARFEAALYARITSPDVRALPRFVGALAQFTHSTDVLDRPLRCQSLREIYTTGDVDGPSV